MKSLRARRSSLAEPATQLAQMNSHSERLKQLPRFAESMKTAGLFPLKPRQIEIFQVNMGKLCNQTCKHCHVDAGPDRDEVMSRETMSQILGILRQSPISTVDITGGAPEMNPNFRWFVEELSKLNKKIMVRCNLTIILANEKYYDLPDFFAKHKVHVVSSLPHYNATQTDRQRGQGVHEKSMRALKMLNDRGYGKSGSGLSLDLVYNPVGAFLPAGQASLEADYKRELKTHFGIEFNNLFTITNMPISRYLEYLIESDNLDDYMSLLVESFNPAAAQGVMCRNTISIGYDGSLYDCDFNQMLELKSQNISHLSQWNEKSLGERAIVLNQHCYGCTAGAGSSCGGSLA